MLGFENTGVFYLLLIIPILYIIEKLFLFSKTIYVSNIAFWKNIRKTPSIVENLKTAFWLQFVIIILLVFTLAEPYFITETRGHLLILYKIKDAMFNEKKLSELLEEKKINNKSNIDLAVISDNKLKIIRNLKYNDVFNYLKGLKPSDLNTFSKILLDNLYELGRYTSISVVGNCYTTLTRNQIKCPEGITTNGFNIGLTQLFYELDKKLDLYRVYVGVENYSKRRVSINLSVDADKKLETIPVKLLPKEYKLINFHIPSFTKNLVLNIPVRDDYVEDNEIRHHISYQLKAIICAPYQWYKHRYGIYRALNTFSNIRTTFFDLDKCPLRKLPEADIYVFNKKLPKKLPGGLVILIEPETMVSSETIVFKDNDGLNFDYSHPAFRDLSVDSFSFFGSKYIKNKDDLAGFLCESLIYVKRDGKIKSLLEVCRKDTVLLVISGFSFEAHTNNINDTDWASNEDAPLPIFFLNILKLIYKDFEITAGLNYLEQQTANFSDTGNLGRMTQEKLKEILQEFENYLMASNRTERNKMYLRSYFKCVIIALLFLLLLRCLLLSKQKKLYLK